MEDLKGKVAVVTGGASGIGKALAERFVAEGMRVVVADVEAGALDATVAELQSAGGDVTGVRTDVTSFESVDALADAAYAAYGAVHVLCNNAGVGPPGGLVWDSTPNDWKWTFSVNVFGVAHGVQAFVPRMLASGEDGHRHQHLVPRRPDRPDAAGVGVRGHQVRGHLPHRVPRRPAGRRGRAVRPRSSTRRARAPRHRPLDLRPQPARRPRPGAASADPGDDGRRAPREGHARSSRSTSWPTWSSTASRPDRFVMVMDVDRYAGTLRERADVIAKLENPTVVHQLGG